MLLICQCTSSTNKDMLLLYVGAGRPAQTRVGSPGRVVLVSESTCIHMDNAWSKRLFQMTQ